MMLIWEEGEPKTNSFEALAGDFTEYVVHHSRCLATSKSEIKIALKECVEKAITFFEVNTKKSSKYFLIIWDAVYCEITLVVTDETCNSDSREVVKCHFVELDELMNSENAQSSLKWEEEIDKFEKQVKTWVSEYWNERGAPEGCKLVAVFSDLDRECLETVSGT